jgi:hypothetical protein
MRIFVFLALFFEQGAQFHTKSCWRQLPPLHAFCAAIGHFRQPADVFIREA